MSTVESESLKEQFQQIQDQQQKKLQRRKQKNEEKMKKKEKSTVSLDSRQSFGIDDNLDLKLADPPAPGSIYSEELTEHLNEQIRELKDETGRLYKLLSERDLELRQLRRKQNEQKDALGSGTSAVTNETAAQKIVELSKKIREITAELESEKTKARQMTKKSMDLEQELRGIKSGLENNSKQPGGGSASSRGSFTSRSYENGERNSGEEVVKLQKKMQQLEMKMSEQRNQCQSLRNEIKMAQKIIEQEVGEGVTIQSLTNSSSGGWRGRAQQIMSLQKKVNDLKSQIEHHPPGSRAETVDLEDELMGTATSRRNLDSKHREELRKMEKEKKEQQERMALDLKALELDYESLKQKLEASKARSKVLATENKAHKQQMQTLLDKGKHDDELIEALLKQQTQLKQCVEDTMEKQRSIEEKNQQATKALSAKSMQENNIVEQLKAIVAEKEAKVHALEEEIQHARLANLQKAQMEGATALFEKPSSRPSSSRPSTAASRPSSTLSSRPPTVQAMLLEEVPTPTPRQGSGLGSRQSTFEGSDRPSSRKASARPNTADRQRLEALQLECQEFQSLYQATTVERDRLGELVQVLEQRIEEITLKVTDTQNELQTQKRKNVQLEKQLGKAKVETQSATRKPAKSKTAMSTASLREAVDSDNMATASMEELQTNLEIQRDENEALKAALQSTLQAKQQDLRLYNQMLEETKKVFLQGLRQYRGAQT